MYERLTVNAQDVLACLKWCWMTLISDCPLVLVLISQPSKIPSLTEQLSLWDPS